MQSAATLPQPRLMKPHSVSPREWSALRNPKWQVPGCELTEFEARRTKYCVCVFVINEGERIRRQLRAMESFAPSADVIIADGGSADGSLAHDYLRQRHVRALLVKTGPGKLSAQMRMAFAYALAEGYEGVITVDGNDKDDVSALPRFIRALDEGFDHVQGSRFIPGGQAINTPRVRLIAVRTIHAPLVSLGARHWYTDTTNGFRAYSSDLLSDPRMAVFRDVFVGYELHYYLAIRAGRLGFRITEIPVTRAYPKHGPVPTKISPFRGNLGIFATLLKAVTHQYNP